MNHLFHKNGQIYSDRFTDSFLLNPKKSLFSSVHRKMNVVAILPQGIEDAGAIELQNLGANLIGISRGKVQLQVDLACFYRIHL